MVRVAHISKWGRALRAAFPPAGAAWLGEHRGRAVHLGAAAAAGLAAVLALATLDRVNAARVRRHAAALAALNLPETSRGVALQRRIVRLPRCLPVYGSSELTEFEPTRADFFFRDHPAAGFRAALIGQPGDRCLFLLEEIAALGRRLRGRKIVIFLSPTWFIAPSDRRGRDHRRRQFLRDFSPVQTALLLDMRMDRALQNAIIRRLAGQGDAIASTFPLLADALAARSGTSAMNACGAGLLTPLLSAQTRLLRWQDRWRTASQAAARPPGAVSARGPVEWPAVLRTFDLALNRRGHATPYSFDLPGASRAEFEAEVARLSAYPQGDRAFLRRMNASPEWADLDLLLRTVRACGAHALLVDQPFNGSVYDACHVDAPTRGRYYERVRALAAARGVALSDWSDFEGDRSFFADLVHPSARAWIYYDQLLDRFYHG